MYRRQQHIGVTSNETLDNSQMKMIDNRCAQESKIFNERSEFFRGLWEKSKYERPSPAQPMPTLLRGLYL